MAKTPVVKPLKRTTVGSIRKTANAAAAPSEYDDPIESRPITKLRKTGLTKI